MLKNILLRIEKLFILVLLIVLFFLCFLMIKYLIESRRNEYKHDDKNTSEINNKNNSPLFINNNELLFDNYPDIKDIVKRTNINIPHEEYMVPQGITVMEDHIVISSYNYWDKDGKSKCYVLNSRGQIINIVILDTNSHVGGIVYDEDHKLLWMPDNNGLLNAYDSNEFLVKKRVKVKYQFNYVSDELSDFQDINKNLISSITYANGSLYISNFFISRSCIVKEYKIVENNKRIMSLSYKRSFNVPPKVQGLSFVRKKDINYIILSTSFGRREPSYLYIYEYDKNIDDYNNQIKLTYMLPPMAEQIVTKEDEIMVLYESSADKYRDGVDRSEYITVLDLNKLIK